MSFSITRYNRPINMRAKAHRANAEFYGIAADLGKLAVGHALSNFEAEGFIDEGFSKWAPRRSGKGGHKILTKTGRLKRSVKLMSASRTKAVVGSNVPYSGIHNKGGVYGGKSYPQRKFLGHSKLLAEASIKVIIKRLNLAARA